MSCKRLIFCSKAKENLTYDDIQSILTMSSKKDKLLDITGFLLWDKEYFIQCMEGDEASVMALFGRIKHDYRHYDVRMLGVCDANTKVFESWTAGAVNSRSLTQKMMFFCLERGEVDIDTLTFKQADCLLQSLSEVL